MLDFFLLLFQVGFLYCYSQQLFIIQAQILMWLGSKIGSRLKQLVRPKVAILKMQGPINVQNTYQLMNQINCLKLSELSGLAIHIESSGGLPTQADIIATRLRFLKNKYGFKLLGFVSDTAVSAGYAVLCAADQVYAHQMAVVGSIGAVIPKMDITKLLEKYQISQITIQSQRTLSTIMSPTTEATETDLEALQSLVTSTHNKFIWYIKQRRGHKLPKSAQKLKQIFDGSTFFGAKALQYGLIDGFGHYSQVIQRLYPNANIIENLLKEPNRKFFI